MAFNGNTGMGNGAISADPGSGNSGNWLIFRPPAPAVGTQQIRLVTNVTCEVWVNGINTGFVTPNTDQYADVTGVTYPVDVETIAIRGTGSNSAMLAGMIFIGTWGNLINRTSQEYDVMKDSPTQNFATLNSVDPTAGTLSDGNLKTTSSTSPSAPTPSTTILGLTEGDYYFEFFGNNGNLLFGITSGDDLLPIGSPLGAGPPGVYFANNFVYGGLGSTTMPLTPNIATTSNWNLAIRVNIDDQEMSFWANGTSQGTYTFAELETTLGGGLVLQDQPLNFFGCSATGTTSYNFGQQPYTFTPPEGTTGLQTQNLPPSIIPDGRNQFQAITTVPPLASGPTTNVAITGQKNWSFNSTIYLSGLDGFNDSQVGVNENQVTGALLNNWVTRGDPNDATWLTNSLNATNSSGERITFTFDPPVVNATASFGGGCDYSCGSLSGYTIPTWNGVEFNFAGSTPQDPSHEVKTAAELSSFGIGQIPWTAPYSASQSWVLAIEADGDIFIDQQVVLTFDSASDFDGFKVGDNVQQNGDPNTIGTITDITDNVVTLASNATWENGDIMVIPRDDLLKYAQEVFPNGMWWLKSRASGNHQLMDSVRGGNFVLQPNTAASETSYVDVGDNAVAWCWKAGDTKVTDNTGSIESQVTVNHEAGFSIVEWVGNGGFDSIGHGLGKRPGLVICRSRQGDHWCVGHDSINTLSSGGSPSQWVNTESFVVSNWAAGLFMDDNNASMSIAATSGINNSGQNMIAYVWTGIPGYSEFGKYEGNNNADGPFVQLPFRPAFVLIKRATADDDWIIYDSTRNPVNGDMSGLYPNQAAGEGTGYVVDLLSNGFKIRDLETLQNRGSTYIYAAFAENPFGGLNVSPVTAR